MGEAAFEKTRNEEAEYRPFPQTLLARLAM
jgi:hypothetical protein